MNTHNKIEQLKKDYENNRRNAITERFTGEASLITTLDGRQVSLSISDIVYLYDSWVFDGELAPNIAKYNLSQNILTNVSNIDRAISDRVADRMIWIWMVE